MASRRHGLAAGRWLIKSRFPHLHACLQRASGAAQKLLAKNIAMTKQFIIFVIDDLSGSATREEMAAIDGFNDRLRSNRQWIFAGGLSAPSCGNVIDNRHGANLSTGKSLFEAQENYSGFWLIQAENLAVASQLALEASKACHRRVELRPLLG